MAQADDIRWMRMALALGARGLGLTWPNPSVGCVIVNENRVVGRACTALGGRPHAEPQALAQAGPQSVGATAYVTLEPCAHHGHTAPCADALISAGISRVVIACQDPDPRVNGGGAERLRAAGIDVETGVMEAEARTQHAGFLSRIQRGRPMVTLKLATTLDGRIATRTGNSQWITGPIARAHVHAQRARHDAVMVGAGTARADDPQLTVRAFVPVRQPVRVVVSKDLNIPADSALMTEVDQIPLWLCHGSEVAEDRRALFSGADLVSCLTGSDGQLDMEQTLQALGAEGLTRVYCEGGGQLAAALLRGGLVDRLHLYSGGTLVGGDGLSCVGDLGVDVLRDAPKLNLVQQKALNGDLFQEWVREPK